MSDNEKNREIKPVSLNEENNTKQEHAPQSRKLGQPQKRASRPVSSAAKARPVVTGQAKIEDIPQRSKRISAEQAAQQPKKKKPLASAAAEDRKARKTADKKKGVWNKLKPFVSVGIAVAVVAVLGVMVFNYAMDHYFSPVDKNNTETIEFKIESNQSLTTISENLQEAGLVRSSTIFKYYVDFTDMSTKIGQGTFKLSPSMSVDEIINAIKRATTDGIPTNITLREGLLVKDTTLASGMATLLVEKGIIKNTESFLDAVATGQAYAAKYDFIQAAVDKNNASDQKRDYILEGYLFPDTYNFYLDSSPNTVITRMLNRFDEIFKDEYVTRAAELGMTVDEVVILASIIEKEAKTKDFKKVSAVFHKRLQIGMKLQSCATHQYFMPVAKLSYNTEEMKVASPYNTYENEGLPIGPICSPGKAAIEAALYPDEAFLKEGYLYFCLGDPATGETVFAKTYPEHLENVAKYEALWREAEKKM